MIFNTPSLYRKKIYQMIDESFECDWFFGDYNYGVKSFDIKELKRAYFLSVKWIYHKSIYYVPGMLRLLFSSDYDRYVLTGSTHNISVWIFALLKFFFLRKKKMYLWTHGCYGNEGPINFFLKKLLIHTTTRCFIYGNYAKDIFVKSGFDENKFSVIHNSLDYDNQLKLRENTLKDDLYHKHFQNHNQTILFIGRLTTVKKLDMIISALSLLKRKGLSYNLVFVGDGNQRRFLEDFAQKKVVEKETWFYGECYDDNINAKMIYNADVCVSPGNVGLTAMHSLMFGTPVITHNNFAKQMPEFEAIKPGKTGDFFECENVESLANSIQKWFEQNANNREEIRQNCYNEIDSHWNPHFQMNVFTQILEK